jgi:hypothetical protein
VRREHAKPFDEDWTAATSCAVSCNDADQTMLVRTQNWFAYDASLCDPDLGKKRVALAAAAPAMYRLLERVEVVGDGACWCSVCHALDAIHSADCEWVAVMKLARGET